MNTWTLPRTARLGEEEYAFNSDFRDMIEILSYLADEERPEYLRWQIALGLFFEKEIPDQYQLDALEYLIQFISYGEQTEKSSPKLFDWQQDSQIIVGEVNKVAGTEIREIPYLHWWTFLSYFYGIGEGQLSTIISIRDKLRRRKKLEKWEQDYYRENKSKVDFVKNYSAEELAEQDRLKKLLGE